MTQPATDQTTQPVVTSTTTTEQPTPAPEAKNGDVKALPQWAQDLISGVRGEAANYRTQLREAQEKLQKAKTPEDFQKATEELAKKNADLERELLVTKVAAKHNLPDDLKDRLRGESEADLEKDAASLARFAPKTEEPKVDPDTLSGGLDPGDSSDDSFDPVALAKQARASRY